MCLFNLIELFVIFIKIKFFITMLLYLDILVNAIILVIY